MFDRILEMTPRLKARWSQYGHLFKEIDIPSRTILLREGEKARNIYLVRKGCLRAYFEGHGKEITFQFFFENSAVASIESFRTNQPSPISIESVEASSLIVLSKKGFELLGKDFPELKDVLLEIVFKRFSDYSRLFHSYIRDTPAERYCNLLKEHPEIVQRVPLQYIASYLGITPVSLSRIRKRL
jgi:CRP-like cAMP-binding protein